MIRSARFPAVRSLGALVLCAGLASPASAAQARPVDQPRAGNQDRAAAEAPKRSWTLRAERVYTADGRILEDAFVRVQDGRIVALGPGGPSGGDVLQVAAITPGLIDLSVPIHSGWRSVEQIRESTPEMRVADSLDLFDPRWRDLLEGGVTTAVVHPATRNVIGGLSVAIKTGGEATLAGRTVAPDVVLSAVIGTAPSSGNFPAFNRPTTVYNRRPTTRMGVEWEARKAFYDTLVARDDEARRFPGYEQLQAVLEGELPLMVQAATTQDIRTSLFLKQEFSIPSLILDAAAEAWKEPELLQRSGAAVILPPFTFNGRSEVDGGVLAWNTAAQLRDLGIPFALSGRGSNDPDARLSMQPTYALRGGLDFDTALASVTSTPARLLGLEERIGTIAVGKDADLVLWSGTPFELTSAVVGVLIGGELVVDPRPAAERP
jgi:imidazolonepropionase-like amidohydrolase